MIMLLTCRRGSYAYDYHKFGRVPRIDIAVGDTIKPECMDRVFSFPTTIPALGILLDKTVLITDVNSPTVTRNDDEDARCAC
jgi:hypothetical protein